MSRISISIVALVLISGILFFIWYLMGVFPAFVRGPLIIKDLFIPVQTRTLGNDPPAETAIPRLSP
ncbi:MAG: hypothetical protein Q8P93_00575 [bacterium]|nr:hypothetical protein [bacterium]